ncbi:MAG: hypothetical protein AAF316_08570 [Cyanobacteria bacterium P01_A01_bin.80]
MINFSVLLTTSIFVTTLIGQSSTAFAPNSNQPVNFISQINNKVNNTTPNSSADNCVESLNKEGKKTRNRHRNSQKRRGQNSETRRNRDGARRNPPKRGDEPELRIVSPKMEITSNKPTIKWCAVEGATSYDVYVEQTSGAKLWDKIHSKEDPQPKNTNLLDLPYPSDEFPLKTGVRYVVRIQARNNKKTIGFANEKFKLISKSQNN